MNPYPKSFQARKKTEVKIRKIKSLKNQCDDLRREIIYRRAGYRSEWSGRAGKKAGGTDILQDHHPAGKPNNRLRYELENGICLTIGEHSWIAHNQGRAEEFRRFILKKKGANFFDKMELLKNQSGKTDLRMIKIYLEAELKKTQKEATWPNLRKKSTLITVSAASTKPSPRHIRTASAV